MDDLVDLLQRIHELLVIVAADLVAGNQVTVDVVKLRIPLAHVFAEIQRLSRLNQSHGFRTVE